jgi:hypothetical protein
MLGIYRVAAQLMASQVVLSSTELVTYLLHFARYIFSVAEKHIYEDQKLSFHLAFNRNRKRFHFLELKYTHYLTDLPKTEDYHLHLGETLTL